APLTERGRLEVALGCGFVGMARVGGVDGRNDLGQPLAVLAHAFLHTVSDVRCPLARRTIAPAARAVIFSWAMGCAAPHLRPMVASALPPLIKSRDNPGIEERFIGRSSMRGRQRWLGAAVGAPPSATHVDRPPRRDAPTA